MVETAGSAANWGAPNGNYTVNHTYLQAVSSAFVYANITNSRGSSFTTYTYLTVANGFVSAVKPRNDSGRTSWAY